MKSGFLLHSFHNLFCSMLAMQAPGFVRPAGLIGFLNTALKYVEFKSLFIISVIGCNPTMFPVVFIKNEG